MRIIASLLKNIIREAPNTNRDNKFPSLFKTLASKQDSSQKTTKLTTSGADQKSSSEQKIRTEQTLLEKFQASNRNLILNGISKIIPDAIKTKFDLFSKKTPDQRSAVAGDKTNEQQPSSAAPSKSLLEARTEVQKVEITNFKELPEILSPLLKDFLKDFNGETSKLVKNISKANDSEGGEGGGIFGGILTALGATKALSFLKKFAGKEIAKVLGKEAAEVAGKQAVKTIGKKAAKAVGKEATEAATKVAGKEATEAAGKQVVKAAGKEATEAATKVAGKEATEAATKVVGKEATEVAGKQVVKAAGKEAAKIGGKSLGKSILKKIPGVGLVAGLGFGAERALSGDWTGAGLELASGAASTIPGVGTAASLGIDAALAGRDVYKAVNEPETTSESPVTSEEKAEPYIENEQKFTPLKDSSSSIDKGLINTVGSSEMEAKWQRFEKTAEEAKLNSTKNSATLSPQKSDVSAKPTEASTQQKPDKNLELIANNTNQTNNVLAELTNGFNNLAKALKESGAIKQAPVVNNIVKGQQQTQSRPSPAQYANAGNSDISNFRKSIVEASRFQAA